MTEKTLPDQEYSGANAEDILDKVLASSQLDRDGFRMSLWAGLYTGPAFVEIERRFGLHRDENNVLFALALYGQLNAKDISDFLGRPKNSISRAVERLLKKQLIRTEVDASDRRRIVLTIEPEGVELYNHTSHFWRTREQQLLSTLSPTERVAFDMLLTKLTTEIFKSRTGTEE